MFTPEELDMTRAVVALVAVVISAACSRELAHGPISPTAGTDRNSAAQFAAAPSLTWSDALATRLALGAPHNHLPGPSTLTSVVSGNSVLLNWQPGPGEVFQFVVEAGSAPGFADIAVFGTGSAVPSLTVNGVPTGLYYVRVRAHLKDGQLTYVSNEVLVAVGNVCPGVVSPTAIAAPRTGATVAIAVTAACPWTAVSQAPFVSVVSGGSGTGSGVVTIAIAPNTGAARTGVVLVAGQAVTISQGAASLHVGFDLFDPSTQQSATHECRINGAASRCVLRSTSFTFGSSSIATYEWTVRYTYAAEVRTRTQSGPSPEFSFTEACGLHGSSADGAPQPLFVSLRITDTAGETAQAESGTFGQPALQLRLYTCP